MVCMHEDMIGQLVAKVEQGMFIHAVGCGNWAEILVEYWFLLEWADYIKAGVWIKANFGINTNIQKQLAGLCLNLASFAKSCLSPEIKNHRTNQNKGMA